MDKASRLIGGIKMLDGYAVWVIVRKVTKRVPKDGSYHISEVAKLAGETEYYSDAIRSATAMIERGQVSLHNRHYKSTPKSMSQELTC